MLNAREQTLNGHSNNEEQSIVFGAEIQCSDTLRIDI